MSFSKSIETPLGAITIRGETKVNEIIFGKRDEYGEGGENAACELLEYFKGERRVFDIVYSASGTPFQKAVWKAISEIPFGATADYTQIARQIGKPKAARAVGNACGKNPLPIVVPCHRVVAKNGLGGFSGGLDKKKLLLAFEAKEIKNEKC